MVNAIPCCTNCTAVIRSFIRDIVDSGHRITGFIKAGVGSFDFRNLARTNMDDSTIEVIYSNFHRDLINQMIIFYFIIVKLVRAAC